MSIQTWEEALTLVPEHMRGGIERYIKLGIPGGSFQSAVFSNDFLGACINADYANKQQLSSYGQFLQYCPHGCYGSQSHVSTWIKRGGLAGKEKPEE